MAINLMDRGVPQSSPSRAAPRLSARPETASQTLVKRWLKAVNERDLDGMVACLDRDASLHPFRLPGLAVVYRGHDGAREWFAHSGRHPSSHIIVTGCRELGPGRVLATGWVDAGEMDDLAPFCGVFRLRRGLIVAARHYLSDPDLVERLALGR